jgi:hypothetical protein
LLESRGRFLESSPNNQPANGARRELNPSVWIIRLFRFDFKGYSKTTKMSFSRARRSRQRIIEKLEKQQSYYLREGPDDPDSTS